MARRAHGGTAKQNNRHKLRPTHCADCGRGLPRRAYRSECATCRKPSELRTGPVRPVGWKAA